MTSQTISRLQAGRTTAWPSLIPVIDWAIHEAREAEYRASVASDQALTGISPTYPVIVTLLAEAVAGLPDADAEDGSL